MPRRSFGSLVCAVFWAVAITVGSSAVMEDGAWNYARRAGAIQLQGWLYSAFLPILLCLAAVAAVVTASSILADRKVRIQLVLSYVANGILNLLWTWLFFRCQRADLALLELPLLWASVGVMIWVASRTNRLGAWLLVPYLAWVIFLGGVSIAIVKVN